jgi:hypothetical protein
LCPIPAANSVTFAAPAHAARPPMPVCPAETVSGRW